MKNIIYLIILIFLVVGCSNPLMEESFEDPYLEELVKEIQQQYFPQITLPPIRKFEEFTNKNGVESDGYVKFSRVNGVLIAISLHIKTENKTEMGIKLKIIHELFHIYDYTILNTPFNATPSRDEDYKLLKDVKPNDILNAEARANLVKQMLHPQLNVNKENLIEYAKVNFGWNGSYFYK